MLGAGAVVAPFAAGCGVGSPFDRKPNIIFLLSDQHRADVLGAEGNGSAITPNLDGLAARGVRFGRAYCNCPMCRPSRASILTAQYPRETHVWTNSGSLDCQGPSHVRRLRDEAGYHTALIGKGHLHLGEGDLDHYRTLLEEFGYRESMEFMGAGESTLIQSCYTRWLVDTTPAGEAPNKYERLKRYVDYHNQNHWLEPWHTDAPDKEPWLLSTADHVDSFAGREAAEWIRGYAGEAPFYLQVGFPGPHNPFDSTVAYRELQWPLAAGIPPGVFAELEGPHSALWEKARAFQDVSAMTEEQLRFVQLIYYAKMAMVDAAVGEILDAVSERGLLEETWIIYGSDHGEMLGDHLLMGKGVFHEPAVRVPLIISPPGGTPGWTCEGITENLDVTATVLGIAGLGGEGSHGTSLVDRVELGPDDPQAQCGRDFAMSEFYLHGMIRTATHKVVVDYATGKAVEAYCLGEDPEERTNRVDDPLLAQLRKDLTETLINAVPV
jgi:choline-sulfatase